MVITIYVNIIIDIIGWFIFYFFPLFWILHCIFDIAIILVHVISYHTFDIAIILVHVISYHIFDIIVILVCDINISIMRHNMVR